MPVRIVVGGFLAVLALAIGCPMVGGPATSETRPESEPSPIPASSPADLLPTGTPLPNATVPETADSARDDEIDPAVLAALALDSDNDGRSDLEELVLGNDPFDPLDGPDIDGDGIPNGEDPDVDGDGIDNADDPDVDGDGILNGDDDDVDGDGLLASEDDDDDGDGILDLLDIDDDGDGEQDCGCENGTCSAFGGFCFCDQGWEGEDCDSFHCRDVFDCGPWGSCIGANECRCVSGAFTVNEHNPCSRFFCAAVNSCSGHGVCIAPNICKCDLDRRLSPDCSKTNCELACNDGFTCTDTNCDDTSTERDGIMVTCNDTVRHDERCPDQGCQKGICDPANPDIA